MQEDQTFDDGRFTRSSYSLMELMKTTKSMTGPVFGHHSRFLIQTPRLAISKIGNEEWRNEGMGNGEWETENEEWGTGNGERGTGNL